MKLFEMSDLGRDHARDAVVVAVLISEPLGHSSDPREPLDRSVKLFVINSESVVAVGERPR